MAAETATGHLENEDMPRGGLGILYASLAREADLTQIARRDLPNDLRERYWIDKVGVRDKKRSFMTVALGLTHNIGRLGVGRSRNDPGDGFRYHVTTGSSGTKDHMEWFEVTERFPTVDPRDVNDFMRSVNGLPLGRAFDPDGFLDGVDLRRPGRSMQRRAADKVIEAVESKLKKPSYQPMLKSYGYGTLVVGLPLWFATLPIDPLRPENVIDDFMCRTQAGLHLLGKKWLRNKGCPFGRVVVVWETTWTAMRQWMSRANLAAYDDPAYLTLKSPFKLTPLMRIVAEVVDDYERENPDEPTPGYTLRVDYERKGRKGRFAQPPPLVRHLADFMAREAKNKRENMLVRAMCTLKHLRLEVLCFLKLHGVVGLERWAAARLPKGRLSLASKRWRSRRLYKESLKRQGFTRSHP